MYYLYIIECNDKTLYTGITTDIQRRFQEHQSRIGSRYTRARGARKVVYVEELGGKGQALKREAAVKKLSRLEKLQLIKRFKTEQT